MRLPVWSKNAQHKPIPPSGLQIRLVGRLPGAVIYLIALPWIDESDEVRVPIGVRSKWA